MKKIGEILVENHLLSKSDLDIALEKQRNNKNHDPLGEILVSMNLITIDKLMAYLDSQVKEHSN